MFDIGFFELLLIGVVALIVIGPNQLPQTLRSMALWWGRFKRGMQNTRTEIEQQLGADDIRRQLHNEEVMRNLKASSQEIQNTLSENARLIQSQLEPPEDEKLPDDSPIDQSQTRAAKDD